MNTIRPASRDLLKLCCRALMEKKAEDLRVLDVGAESSITDYLVLATATSEPHLRALRGELEFALKSAHTRLVGLEAAEQSGWTVVDAFDVIVHLFLPAQREHYGLESLWKDAVPVSVDALLDLAPPAPVAPKAAPVRRPAAGKKAAPRKQAAPARKKAAVKARPARATKKTAPKPAGRRKATPKTAAKPKPKAKVKPKAKSPTAARRR
jgi:ribosome-associated protein